MLTPKESSKREDRASDITISNQKTERISIEGSHKKQRVSLVALVAKNLPASAADTRDMGLIHRWGRSPGEGNG